MARCGCSSATCSCSVRGATGVVVQGVGTLSRPYLISIDAGQLTVDDTPTVDMRLTGDGTSASPYHISALATVNLDALTDVTAPTPANGQVLAYDLTAKQWKPVPPVTATPGAINRGNGLTGDGSAGAPLVAVANAAAGVVVDGNGIGLQSGILAAINRAAARPNILFGTMTLTYTTASAWQSGLITFPAGAFTATPVVVASPDAHTGGANPYSVQCYNISATGARLGSRLPAAVAGTMAVHWIAIGPGA